MSEHWLNWRPHLSRTSVLWLRSSTEIQVEELNISEEVPTIARIWVTLLSLKGTNVNFALSFVMSVQLLGWEYSWYQAWFKLTDQTCNESWSNVQTVVPLSTCNRATVTCNWHVTPAIIKCLQLLYTIATEVLCKGCKVYLTCTWCKFLQRQFP